MKAVASDENETENCFITFMDTEEAFWPRESAREGGE